MSPGRAASTLKYKVISPTPRAVPFFPNFIMHILKSYHLLTSHAYDLLQTDFSFHDQIHLFLKFIYFSIHASKYASLIFICCYNVSGTDFVNGLNGAPILQTFK